MRRSTSRASRDSDLTASLLRAAAAALIGAAAFSATGQSPAWSLEAQRRLSGGSPASISQDLARRAALVDEGEARLAAGATEAAQQAFDNAALLVHAADVELGLVRTYMQAGEYRRALTFASHAAGAHREFPGGMALYAWLLHVGGQHATALRLLDEAVARAPGDSALQQAKTVLSSPAQRAQGVLMARPLRLAPYDESGRVDAGAQVVGSGVLLGGGTTALASAAAVAGARRIWVRNGLGRAAAATVLRRLPDEALVLLQLDVSLDAPRALTIVPRAPFAGGPSYAVEFDASADAAPAWPTMRQGFFARLTDPQVWRPLGIDMPSGPRGGPVFDGAGRLAGIAVTAADGSYRMVPVSTLTEWAAGNASTSLPEAAAARSIGVDTLYEQALRLTLQVIVDR